MYIVKLNLDGVPTSSPIVLSDNYNAKSEISQTDIVNNQCVFVWREGESRGVIKAQNFVTSGSIGPSGIETIGTLIDRPPISLSYNQQDQTLSFIGLNGRHQMVLYSSIGQTLFSSSFSGSCKIPSLPAGLYYVVVTNSNGQCVCKDRIFII